VHYYCSLKCYQDHDVDHSKLCTIYLEKIAPKWDDFQYSDTAVDHGARCLNGADYFAQLAEVYYNKCENENSIFASY
jgi:hypothetical protein